MTVSTVIVNVSIYHNLTLYQKLFQSKVMVRVLIKKTVIMGAFTKKKLIVMMRVLAKNK